MATITVQENKEDALTFTAVTKEVTKVPLCENFLKCYKMFQKSQPVRSIESHPLCKMWHHQGRQANRWFVNYCWSHWWQIKTKRTESYQRNVQEIVTRRRITLGGKCTLRETVINFIEDFQATYDAKSIILSINHQKKLKVIRHLV